MKKKTQLLLIPLLLVVVQLMAQSTDGIAVKQPIEQLFTGMRTSDSTLVRATLLAGGHLEGIVKKPNGDISVKSDSFEGFLKNIAKATSGDLDERISRIEIRVDDDMATAWTPYQFYYKGNFSHCGVNTFRLIKTPSGWKIWSILDTRRKENCVE